MGKASAIHRPLISLVRIVSVYTVTDEHGGAANATVNVTVNADNDAPTISDIANRFVVEGNSTGVIPFTVSDIETAAGDLVVTLHRLTKP